MVYVHDNSDNNIEYALDYRGGHYISTLYCNNVRQGRKTRINIADMAKTLKINREMLVNRIRA